MACALRLNDLLHKQRKARHLVQQRYDWQQIGRRFVALVEDVAQPRGSA